MGAQSGDSEDFPCRSTISKLKTRQEKRLLISLDATPPRLVDERCPMRQCWRLGNEVPTNLENVPGYSSGASGPWLTRTEPWNCQLSFITLSSRCPTLEGFTCWTCCTYGVHWYLGPYLGTTNFNICHLCSDHPRTSDDLQSGKCHPPELGNPPVSRFITKTQNRSKNKPTLK